MKFVTAASALWLTAWPAFAQAPPSPNPVQETMQRLVAIKEIQAMQQGANAPTWLSSARDVSVISIALLAGGGLVYALIRHRAMVESQKQTLEAIQAATTVLREQDLLAAATLLAPKLMGSVKGIRDATAKDFGILQFGSDLREMRRESAEKLGKSDEQLAAYVLAQAQVMTAMRPVVLPRPIVAAAPSPAPDASGTLHLEKAHLVDEDLVELPPTATRKKSMPRRAVTAPRANGSRAGA